MHCVLRFTFQMVLLCAHFYVVLEESTPFISKRSGAYSYGGARHIFKTNRRTRQCKKQYLTWEGATLISSSSDTGISFRMSRGIKQPADTPRWLATVEACFRWGVCRAAVMSHKKQATYAGLFIAQRFGGFSRTRKKFRAFKALEN